MDQFEVYVGLLGIIILVGVLLGKSSIPTPLFLVITGMLLSLLPNFPAVHVEPELILDIFLPLLVYEMSALTSWPDIKKNKRPIAFLSVGHVIFITILVAVTAHALIPGLSWSMAFVLGAVVSPPDDVAIIVIAEKLGMPRRIVTILTGEGLLNDATALTIFRFSLAALFAQQFSLMTAFSGFLAVIFFETLYGLLIGYVMGSLRLKIKDPKLHMMMSLLTPFLAYLPAVHFGGSGVLATVVAGFVIGHQFLIRYTPEVRLLGRSLWEMIGFVLQSFLFLLVGLNFSSIVSNISSIPYNELLLYAAAITLVVIVGRFIWVFPLTYLPRYFFKSLRKKDPYPPWQFPFVISWAGLRGGVSLAAVLSVPHIADKVGAADLRDLLIFLVFCVICATLLLQGMTLPWLLKVLGVRNIGMIEEESDHISELSAQLEMTKSVLHFLADYKTLIKLDADVLQQVKLQTLEYEALKKRIIIMIKEHEDHQTLPLSEDHREKECSLLVLTQIIEVERTTLTKLWREGKISHKVRVRLMQNLDLRAKHLSA